MPLPLKAIDRLFDRLTATYGREFSVKFDGVESSAVKSSWAHELSSFEKHLHMIAWALENLPERAPNVIQFKNLVRQAPELQVKLLPLPKADPERVAAELAKLSEPKKQAIARAAGGLDGKEWARRILARFDSGDLINQYSINLAKQALL
jgi:hypothetical protein